MEADGTVRSASVGEWANNYDRKQNRHVADDIVPGIRVSTVFLGVDHNFGSEGLPILFETMWFYTGEDALSAEVATIVGEVQDRYCTRDQALAGHAVWLARARAFSGERGSALRKALLSVAVQGDSWEKVDELIATAP